MTLRCRRTITLEKPTATNDRNLSGDGGRVKYEGTDSTACFGNHLLYMFIGHHTPGRTRSGHGRKRGAKRHVKDLTKTSYPLIFNVLRLNRNPMFPHSHPGGRHTQGRNSLSEFDCGKILLNVDHTLTSGRPGDRIPTGGKRPKADIRLILS